MGEAAVKIEYLRKVYRGGIEALGGVALEVPAGSVFGLLGPNGAGKSTLIKVLLTILRPSECRGSMLGAPIGTKRVLGRVGYLPENARFPDYLTGAQIVECAAALAGMSAAQTRARLPGLLERVGMAEAAGRRMGSYSKGMRQRIGLAQALINDPELVFLDEPTDGVDPEGRIEVLRMIRELRDEGRTVFVNSHLLSEVEQVADRVAIMAKGRVVESGAVAELTVAGRYFEVRSVGPVPAGLRAQLDGGGRVVAGDRITLGGSDPAPVQEVIDTLRAAGVAIREVREVRRSLEDLFLTAVRNHQPTN